MLKDISLWDFPVGASDKEPACQCWRQGDAGLTPGSERSPGRGHGDPFQYSFLENPMDRGAWWATVHQVAKSGTLLKWLSTHSTWHQIIFIFILFFPFSQPFFHFRKAVISGNSFCFYHHEFLDFLYRLKIFSIKWRWYFIFLCYVQAYNFLTFVNGMITIKFWEISSVLKWGGVIKWVVYTAALSCV